MKKLKVFVFISIMMCLALILCGCDDSSSKNQTKNKGGVNMTSSSANKTNSTSGNNTKDSSNTSSSSNEAIDIEKYDFVGAGKVQIQMPEKGETIAVLHIKNYGDIKVKFFANIAPKAVENFIKLAEKGYYNGVTFHRVMNDFMIQGGDPTATGRGGESIWGAPFVDEFDISLVPYRGALCMANSGSNTNGSQFFIEQAKYDSSTEEMLESMEYPKSLLEAYKVYGGSMHLFCRHTVFGQVIEGMDVVDKIAGCETDENDKPLEDVVIESIDITTF